MRLGILSMTVSHTHAAPSDHFPVLAFQTGLVSGEEDDNDFDD